MTHTPAELRKIADLESDLRTLAAATIEAEKYIDISAYSYWKTTHAKAITLAQGILEGGE